jgi:putative glutamine amidotransferase
MINIKRFSKVFIVTFILVVLPICLAGNAPRAPGGDGEITIAMCRPLVSQIKNIEEMFEKDVIPLRRIKLICVYHKDEVTDYKQSYEYVEENGLSWVTFETIEGEVAIKDLFGRNLWSEQFKRIFDSSDGIIFTGGMDIPPAVYGERQLLLTVATTPVRTYYEASFLFHLLGGSQDPGFTPLLESRKDYVVLGICLGCQTMNVACGGSLYQDIPTQVYGRSTFEGVLEARPDARHSYSYIKGLHPLEKNLAPAFHRIKLNAAGLFVKEMKMNAGDKPFVLTSHHQALKKIGKNLTVIASSLDGKIVEAVAHKLYKNVLGIQFHPEPYSLYMKGTYYKAAPGKPRDFNLRYFLEDNPPSMEFHKKIWQWFSTRLAKERK